MRILIFATMLATTLPINAQRLFDRFFDEYYFPFNPTTATYSGIHTYDSKLDDYSRAGEMKRAQTQQVRYCLD